MKNNNNNLALKISQIVFVARARCGFTQAQLAKKVGTFQPGIARLENGNSLPSLNLLNRVANALDQNIKFDLEPKNRNDLRFVKPQNSSLSINPSVSIAGSQSLSFDLQKFVYSSPSSLYDKVLS